jgi:hypothetical protein
MPFTGRKWRPDQSDSDKVALTICDWGKVRPFLSSPSPPPKQGFSVKNEKEQKTPELGKVNCPKNQPRQVNNAVYHIESP